MAIIFGRGEDKYMEGRRMAFCYQCGRNLNNDEHYHVIQTNTDPRRAPVCRDQFSCQVRMCNFFGEKPDKLQKAAAKRVVM